MADEDHLMESAKVHSPAQHAHVLLAIGGIQSAHRFVPEQRFVTNTRKGNTLYVQVYNWPGSTVAVGGIKTKVNSAKLFLTGQEVEVKQEGVRVQITGLPEKAPEEPITSIAVECEGEPVQ